MNILVINGPNLNMLGIREPDIYSSETYDDLVKYIQEAKGSHDLDFFQSNHEGALVDRIQQAYYEGVQGIVINPGAYTHTSIALLDAVRAVSIPTVEVHLSDVSEREPYRQLSYIREAAIATVMGEGFAGYVHAIDLLEAFTGEN